MRRQARSIKHPSYLIHTHDPHHRAAHPQERVYDDNGLLMSAFELVDATRPGYLSHEIMDKVGPTKEVVRLPVKPALKGADIRPTAEFHYHRCVIRMS